MTDTIAFSGQLFKLLMESELSEAEIVDAICLAATMRLAAQTETLPQLFAKVDQLAEVFKLYARCHQEKFSKAQAANLETT